MSRRFAGVGVGISAARLQEIAAGAPAAADELANVNFALVATEMKRQERLAKSKRSRRRSIRWLLVAGLVVVAVNLLSCLAYVFISLALHASAF
jgi:hypothetical protein